MSNVWHYTLFIHPQHLLSNERIAEIVEQAKARGYSINHPDTGRILLARVDLKTFEYHSYELDDFTSVMTLLGQVGGIVDLWKGDINIGLGFDPSGTEETWIIKTLGLQDTPTYGKVSISVRDYLFRRDSAQRDMLAKDIEGLFCDFCMSLKAVYGYSADETALEFFASDMHIHEDTRLHRSPSVLFWFNYFTVEHIAQIHGRARLQQIGGKMKELPNGILVSFFDKPWGVKIDELDSINKKWHDLSAMI